MVSGFAALRLLGGCVGMPDKSGIQDGGFILAHNSRATVHPGGEGVGAGEGAGSPSHCTHSQEADR